MDKPRSFQRTTFLSVGALFLLFAVCFSLYQYRREREYKTDILHSRLQMYNYEMMQTVGASPRPVARDFARYVAGHRMEGLRVTVLDTLGRVLYDSDGPRAMGNHLDRAEVRQALRKGSGYDIKRASASTHRTYFYSATRFGPLVARSAVPYSAKLTKSLRADSSYAYFALAVTALLGLALYWSTARISRHVACLREFARKAEEGSELDHELERALPDDELGDISHTIIALYWRLRHSEEDKVRIKRQLTQNAAHELKTPAAGIHGLLETILSHPDMPHAQRQHFLERCYAQSERMCKLLLDMSTLTRLDAMDEDRAAAPARKRETNAAAALRAALDDTALQLRDKGIRAELNVPARVVVPGDPDLLYSVFRNIIDNAVAHAQGATLLRVVCAECEDEERAGARATRSKRYYELTFSDNGPGVDPQHLPHLFERFYRVDQGRSRKLGGTGLGLAIVKNAVAAHGGTARAEPTPGGGLTIRLTLMREA